MEYMPLRLKSLSAEKGGLWIKTGMLKDEAFLYLPIRKPITAESTKLTRSMLNTMRAA